MTFYQIYKLDKAYVRAQVKAVTDLEFTTGPLAIGKRTCHNYNITGTVSSPGGMA